MRSPSPHQGSVVGVDRGGTWTRVQELSFDGKAKRHHRSKSPELADLPTFLKSLFHSWKLKPRSLAVASRGVWTMAERQTLKRRCRHLATVVEVMPDVEAAWLAAFGDQKHREGILVIAGTGSIAYGRTKRGKIIRVGGLGPLLGDEGSAFWMGREWIKSQNLSAPRGSTPATIATFSRPLFSAAARGHRGAKDILHRAQHHLVVLVLEAATSLKLRRAVLLSWTGSVLLEPTFRRGFLQQLKHHSREFIAIEPAVDPATAAARFLLR